MQRTLVAALIAAGLILTAPLLAQETDAAVQPAAIGAPVAETEVPTTDVAGSEEEAAAPVQDAASPPPVRMVERGSTLTFMIMTEVDSNRALPGTPIKLRLHEPLVVDGLVIIPKGAVALGEVVASERAGATLKKGTISIRLKEMLFGDRHFALSAELSRKGKGGKADDALKAILVPFYALFAPGNSARLKAGELLSAPLDQDICFTTSDLGASLADCPSSSPPTPERQEPPIFTDGSQLS